MEFGKVNDVFTTDFSLPEDPPENRELLERSILPARKAEICIGATGWGMKEWVGLIYPMGTKPSDYLLHYARFFNTIELNSTYYRVPTPETIRKWFGQTAERFRFCPKIPQFISHSGDLKPNGGWTPVEDFCETIENLGLKMGICFLQLPPYFDYQRLPHLQEFLDEWTSRTYRIGQKSVPIAIEFRHASWFSKSQHLDNTIEMLAARGVGTVITDVGGRRDVAHMRLSNQTVLVRFVCCGEKEIDLQRMRQWSKRLSEWVDFGLKDAYFFVHTPDNTDAPPMAAMFSELLGKSTGGKANFPALTLNSLPGNQMSLF